MHNEEEIHINQEEFEDDTEFVDEDIQKTLKKLKEDMKVLKKERQEYLEGWQRAKADYVNRENEFKDELDRAKMRTKIALLEDFIAISDSFESAMSNKELWESVPANWRIGVEYISKQLTTIFENNQLVQIPVIVGSEIDPTTQEVLQEESVLEESQHHKIINVVRSGWKMGARIVRPVQVIIGNYQSN